MNLEDYLKGEFGFTYKDKMSKIKEILKELAGKGFFDELKEHKQIIQKLDSRGFTIEGRKAGMVGRLLTELCQEGLLEREKDKDGNWGYKKYG